MDVNIIPQVYASVVYSPSEVPPEVPKGEINIIPQVYASVVYSPSEVPPEVPVGHDEKAIADTSRNISVYEKISVDTLLTIKKFESVIADTERNVVRVEKTIADTVIRYPHNLNYFTDDIFVNTFKDYAITSFEVALNERTLSDTFRFDTAHQLQINDAVKGRLLDYLFSFLVEETRQTEAIQSVSGMYDVDKLLYTYISWDELDAESKYPKASEIVNQLANYFGFTPNIRIADFTPYYATSNLKITYSDLISNLFGWTSRIPQRQINVFIRGGTLNCIQRGMEESIFDITDLPHSRLTVNKKIIRSMYNSPFEDTEESEDVPFTGDVSFDNENGGALLSFSNGLLVSETMWEISAQSRHSSKTIYSYNQIRDNYYLASKSIINENSGEKSIYTSDGWRVIESDNSLTTESVYTTCSYENIGDEIYQTSEVEVNQKSEYQDGELIDEETNTRTTYHRPLGNGFYSTTVYINGVHQGSSISQGAPSNSVSQYTIQKIRHGFNALSKDPEERYQQRRSRLAPIADISFPVRELDLLEELTNALNWLNRKIQVTVNVDLISKIVDRVPDLKHVVDFTERVKLDGAEYFLVSNNVSLTPRKLIQRLELVRWTE